MFPSTKHSCFLFQHFTTGSDVSSGLSNVQQRDRKILGSGSKITKTHLNTFEDFCVHIQDLTPENGGDFDSKLRAWDTSLHTLHNTNGQFQQKRLGRVPGEKAWQRYFVTESSRWSVIRNVGRSPGCLACSKRSDSGERCGVKKVMKSRVVGAPFYFAPLPTI